MSGENSTKQNAEIRSKYFDYLKPQLEKHWSKCTKKSYWIKVESKYAGISFNAVIQNDKAFAEVYIDTKNAEKNTEIFNSLIILREDIDISFGNKLQWGQANGVPYRIRFPFAKEIGSHEAQDDEKRRDELVKFHIETIQRLIHVFEKPLEMVMDGLS
jgi:hypothetical protein